MKKSLLIAIIIGVFVAAVYLFETGEKDHTIKPNEAPSQVIG